MTSLAARLLARRRPRITPADARGSNALEGVRATRVSRKHPSVDAAPCSTCRAKKGELCKGPYGHKWGTHVTRRTAAKEKR